MRIAGIDYGTVRIGIAMADTEVGIAGPYENYTRRTLALDAEYFARLAKDEQIGRFVVGLPVHLHGGESQKSTEARAFGEWLGEVTGVPVEFFDERFTTAEADELLECRQAHQEAAQGPPRPARRPNHAHRVPRSRRAAARIRPAESIETMQFAEVSRRGTEIAEIIRYSAFSAPLRERSIR